MQQVMTQTYATIALRGLVVFPGVTTTFEIARRSSVKALKYAEENGSLVFLVTQKDSDVIDPDGQDLYSVGVVARIERSLRLSGGNRQIVVQGLFRAQIVSVSHDEASEFLITEVCPLETTPCNDEKKSDAAVLRAYNAYRSYLRFVPRPSDEVAEILEGSSDVGFIADVLAASLLVKYQQKQQILELGDALERIDAVSTMLEHDAEIFELEGKIQTKVKAKLQKTQRDIYLREQLAAIKAELGGDAEEDETDDDEEYREAIRHAKLPEEVRAKLRKEAAKLSKMMFGSAEASVIRTYLDTCLELPWEKLSKDRIDLAKAKKILDADHDGLDKVKERILEYLAVRRLTNSAGGQIICLVGPPGVGKTSVARSIAAAMNRKYVRIALGGIRDEAEIRGHRRTYVGSMPGRIITALRQAGTRNPLMLLDEIDKLTSDMHGDPASALLEVLDADQNKTFRDNFIELPFDLSQVMFIATANTTHTIPPALLDRMEIIEMVSYTAEQKLSIAKNHLIPKQMKAHGLSKRNLRITDETVNEIISKYTREAGVRNLEREIGTICRKTAKLVVEDSTASVTVTPEKLPEMLGVPHFDDEKIYSGDEVGVVNGLAWTEVGGDLLRIETVSMEGTGKLELTGSLGDVMKESAHAAVSYIRKHCDEYGIDGEFHKTRDIHVHVPEGAIPKDGPSAGITIATSILSELSGRPVKRNVAMTGELTLTGRVLRIGGLREKAFAAYKAGVDTVIIPKDNECDIPELDEAVRKKISFIPVENYSQVPASVLVNP